MKNDVEDWVNSKIKGRISEMLFEELFINLGFFVIKIGQEHTATPLIQIEKFIKTCGGDFRIDRKSEDNVELDYIRRLPDFAIIDKRGCVNLMEIKYRRKGILNKEDLSSLHIYKHSEVFFVSLNEREVFHIFYLDNEDLLKIVGLREWLKTKFNIENEEVIDLFESIARQWYKKGKLKRNNKERKVNFEKEASRIAEIKKESPHAYQEWSSEEEAKLKEHFSRGIPIEDIAVLFQRQEGGIKARLKRLGLIEFDTEGDDTTHKTFYK